MQSISGLFYASNHLMEVGTVIPPGNFGKNILSYSINHEQWKVVRELIFEQVRQIEAPQLPSRMNCCFLFDDLEVAKQSCRDLGLNLAPMIYRVEPINSDASLCLSNFDVSATINGERFIPSLFEAASTYWKDAANNRKPANGRTEILSGSAVRIIEVAYRSDEFDSALDILGTKKLLPNNLG